MDRYREGIASMTEVLQDENADERSPKQLYQCPLQLPDNQSDFAEADGQLET